MLLELQDFFDDYSKAINGYHIYYKPDRISISFSPKTQTQHSYIEHLLNNLIKKIKPVLKEHITLEVTVNNMPSIKKVMVSKTDPEEETEVITTEDPPAFDYMDAEMD